MLREVAERAHAERLRAVFAHRERVAVVEAERHRGAEAERRERAVEFGKARVPFELENFLRDRAGVFRIEVDRPGLERCVQDAGIAQARPVHGTVSRGTDQDLAQDVGLGEALGADAQRLSICCA